MQDSRSYKNYIIFLREDIVRNEQENECKPQKENNQERSGSKDFLKNFVGVYKGTSQEEVLSFVTNEYQFNRNELEITEVNDICTLVKKESTPVPGQTNIYDYL